MLIAELHLQIKHVFARSSFPKILNLRGDQNGKKSPRKTSQRRIPASDRDNHYQNRNDTMIVFTDSCSAQSGKIAGIEVLHCSHVGWQEQ